MKQQLLSQRRDCPYFFFPAQRKLQGMVGMAASCRVPSGDAIRPNSRVMHWRLRYVACPPLHIVETFVLGLFRGVIEDGLRRCVWSARSRNFQTVEGATEQRSKSATFQHSSRGISIIVDARVWATQDCMSMMDHLP